MLHRLRPTSSSTSTAPVVVPTEAETPSPADEDDDRYAHYVRKSDAAKAYVEGTPVRALCGKVWVPSRDPSRYPVCPDCTKIRDRLLRRGLN